MYTDKKIREMKRVSESSAATATPRDVCLSSVEDKLSYFSEIIAKVSTKFMTEGLAPLESSASPIDSQLRHSWTNAGEKAQSDSI